MNPSYFIIVTLLMPTMLIDNHIIIFFFNYNTFSGLLWTLAQEQDQYHKASEEFPTPQYKITNSNHMISSKQMVF